MNIENKHHALAYRDKLGWSVIPLKASSKLPLQRWSIYQSQHPTDRDINRWQWDNLAAVTGAISNLVVIDEDDLSILTQRDRALAEDFLKKLPETATSVTSKGSHRFYRLTDEVGLVGPGNALSVDSGDTVPSRVRFLPGLDCRGEGGYVVIPPSVHPSGHIYTWTEQPGPTEPDDLTVLPQWAAEQIRQSDARTKWSVKELVKGAKSGERNNSAAKYIGTLLAKKHPDLFPDQWEAVRAWNKRNSPPMAEDELWTVFQSIAKREIKKREGAVDIESAEEEPAQRFYVSEALATPPPKTPHIISGILPMGFTTLVGKPKTGKSFLAMKFALSVALGARPFKEQTDCKVLKGNVLYYALEDSEARFAERLAGLFGPKGVEELRKLPNEAFTFITKRASTYEAGLANLSAALDNDPNLRLIVIDTLAAFTGTAGPKRGESAFTADYRITRPLFDLARERDVAILVVHHARKDIKGSVDPFDSVAGTLGTNATADTLLVLHKAHHPGRKAQYHLLGQSREYEEFDLPLVRNGTGWTIGREGFTKNDD